MTYRKIKIRVFGHAQWVQFAGGHKLSLVYLNGIIKSSSQTNPGTLCIIQTKLALISFIQQLRDDENNLYQYLAYVAPIVITCNIWFPWSLCRVLSCRWRIDE